MKKVWKFLYDIKDYIIILLVVILVRSFLFTPARVNGASMNNTLQDGQIVILNKINMTIKDPSRFQIVVINNRKDNDRIIKRVIGLPNEKIEYKDNSLYVNGELIIEDYEHGLTEDFVYNTHDDEYFVLGDNRTVSKDSRYLGAFHKKDILGSVQLRLYPFNKIGRI